MPGPKIDLLVAQMEKARRDTLAAAGNVPVEARLRQLQEGKATPLWLLGHLANTVNTVVLRWIFLQESILTREQAKAFSPDFAMGLPPSTDASQYPTWDEVVALYDTAMTRAIDGMRELDEGQLPEALPGKLPDPLRAFFSSIETTLMQMVSHDAYHRGQIGMLAALKLD